MKKEEVEEDAAVKSEEAPVKEEEAQEAAVKDEESQEDDGAEHHDNEEDVGQLKTEDEAEVAEPDALDDSLARLQHWHEQEEAGLREAAAEEEWQPDEEVADGGDDWQSGEEVAEGGDDDEEAAAAAAVAAEVEVLEPLNNIKDENH